jgi:anti-anti-sigma regulatory factor
VFAEALTKVIENGEGESVHLDLAELEFMDLGALSLMDTISTADQTSGPIVLNRVPPHLTEVIGALGWRRLPGLSQGDVPKPRRPV